MSVLLAWAAAIVLSPMEIAAAPQVASMAARDVSEGLRHAEVIRVERDFGREHVDVAIDAWMPTGDATRIEDVRLWWSDGAERRPFSDRLRAHLGLRYERVRPDRWQVSLRAEGQRVTFDVALDRGRPRVFADVVVPGDRVVRQCRVDGALLRAKRVLGIAVSLRNMAVTCTGPDGRRHSGTVRAVRS